MKPVLLFGAGDFSSVVRALALACGREVVGVIDETIESPEIICSLQKAKDAFPPDRYDIVLAVGYSNLSGRWQARERIRTAGYRLATLIHPTAHVVDDAAVGEGSLVMAGSIVDINASIGEAGVVWPGVVVNHDSTVGDNTFLSPNCTVCGFVKVGRHCFVGAGAVIADHVVVSDAQFIKAGCVFSKGRSV